MFRDLAGAPDRQSNRCDEHRLASGALLLSYGSVGENWPTARWLSGARPKAAAATMEYDMSEKRNQAEGGTNARPLDESVAGTAPGIPDEARGPGEEIPQPPTDEEVDRAARRMKEGRGEKGA